MRELREILTTIRTKGMAGTTPEDLRILIARVVKMAGAISAAAALIRGITGLITAAAVLREEMAGRIIDLKA